MGQHKVYSGGLAVFALAGALAVAGPFSSVTPALAQGVDLDQVFNCAEDGPIGEQTPDECLAARDMVLNNCTACHTFVPIVQAQKSAEAWDATLEVHRSRVEMSDEDYNQLRDFLVSHFNETNPVPDLPDALEQMGTNQAF